MRSVRASTPAGSSSMRTTSSSPSRNASTTGCTTNPATAARSTSTVDADLHAAGMLQCASDGGPEFVDGNGRRARVVHRADMVSDGPLDETKPMVVQVSRWDRLKDPVGVLRGFADHIAPRTDAQLVLAGPESAAIADDPDGVAVLDDVIAARERVAPDFRWRIHLACLPMQDDGENGAIVNALQRRADVVGQKSLAEGFGLTVAEAMWKRRAVVASARGGIKRQVVDGETGVLLHD